MRGRGDGGRGGGGGRSSSGLGSSRDWAAAGAGAAGLNKEPPPISAAPSEWPRVVRSLPRCSADWTSWCVGRCRTEWSPTRRQKWRPQAWGKRPATELSLEAVLIAEARLAGVLKVGAGGNGGGGGGGTMPGPAAAASFDPAAGAGGKGATRLGRAPPCSRSTPFHPLRWTRKRGRGLAFANGVAATVRSTCRRTRRRDTRRRCRWRGP